MSLNSIAGDWKHYNLKQLGLPQISGNKGPGISSMVEDSSGKLWIGFDNNGHDLVIINDTIPFYITNKENYGSIPITIWKLFCDDKNQIWALGDIKGIVINELYWKNLLFLSGDTNKLPYYRVKYVTDTSDFWYNGLNGLNHYKNGNWIKCDSLNQNPNGIFYGDFKKDNQGRLWSRNYKGFLIIDGDNYSRAEIYPDSSFTKYGSDCKSEMNGYILDDNNNIWMVNNKYGIFEFNGNQWKNYRAYDSTFLSDSFYDLTKDNSGNIWFGSEKEVVRFDGINWTSFNKFNSEMKSNYITCIYWSNKKNILYVGTALDGLYVYYPNGFPFTSITEEIKKMGNIKPIPATDYIEINVGAGSKHNLMIDFQIFNLTGEKISSPSDLSPALSEGEGVRKIDVSNLAPGVYFIKIGDKFEKFVKM